MQKTSESSKPFYHSFVPSFKDEFENLGTQETTELNELASEIPRNIEHGQH